MSQPNRAGATRVLVLSRPCLDVTLVVDELPRLGQEVSARSRLVSPGGGAITAIAAQRLGLEAGIAYRAGTDVWGALLTTSLEAEGVTVPEPDPSRETAITTVMSAGKDRAMVSSGDDVPIDPAWVEAFDPGVIVCDVDQLAIVPPGVAAYVSCSDATSRQWAGRLPELGQQHTLIANRPEATALTGLSDPVASAHALARYVPRVVVTCGADGAVAVIDGQEYRPTAHRVPVVDTTGAGDVSTATLVWAGCCDLPPAQSLEWMTLHGALSTAATGVAGALPVERLIAHGKARGLTAPERPRR